MRAREHDSRTAIARLDERSDVELADGEADVRGWRVVGSDGTAVGTVAHLIADATAMRVRFLEVALEPTRSRASQAGGVLVAMEAVNGSSVRHGGGSREQPLLPGREHEGHAIALP